MKFTKLFCGLLAVGSYYFNGASAQYTTGTYTDPATGIIFYTINYPVGGSPPTGITLGYAFPPSASTTDATEFIGLIIGGRNDSHGWTGQSMSPSMTQSLLLVAWANGDQVLTSFRYATGYTTPDLYTGNATLTQISHSVNATAFNLIYRCQNCLSWNQGGATGGWSTSGGSIAFSWAQAMEDPVTPSDPNSQVLQHQYQGNFGFGTGSATQASYSAWAALATPPTSTSTSATATATATSGYSSIPVPTGTTFDYVVVGGGAGGVPFAARAAAAGKNTLLIEKGPPSSGRWGGTLKPDWLQGTNLTRFDVPGLCNEIWVNSAGVACTDMDQMAGCVLGGGTAVNAGLWWKPNPKDWDFNFPTGWKASDMVAATNRVFQTIPGTDVPSMDGKLYLQQGFNLVSGALARKGWRNLPHANDFPALKNRTFAHTPYMFSNGERGGPLATYLVSAAARPNFKLWTKTTVRRVIRTAGHVTALEVEPYQDGGYKGIVKVTPNSGRVILSAGTFGSAKILMRSGIGPADQLAIVKSSAIDGATMIDSKSWINLPVGYNLDDHVNTDAVIWHPSVVFYDFYQAWTDPIPADKAAYLDHRSGILAQAAPNIGPMFWEEITGADSIVRQLQWTARCEGPTDALNPHSMTLSQYLGRGAVSRGRMTITAALTTQVSTPPYLNDKNDLAVVIQGLQNIMDAMNTIPNVTWVKPAPGQSAADYVNSLPLTPSARRANHWTGSAKLGADDGRVGSGTAVVDLNAKVYGTDNLFVVDASIFPGMVSTNPSALVVVASERAADRILGLAAPVAGHTGAQCGGTTWSGSAICLPPLTCKYVTAAKWTCQ